MRTTEETIRQQIEEHAILLYMKGTPETPQCGFSAKAVALLQQMNVTFASVDVLANPFIREKLPQVSDWPTFPQLFVRGELVGGSDIMSELARTGELQRLFTTGAAPQPEK